MMLGLFTLVVFVFCLGGLLAGIWCAFVYVGLDGGRKKCAAALLEVQGELEARYEMLPALVEAARGHMRHEREVLESVLSATALASTALQNLRASALVPGCFNALLEAEEVLEGGVMKLFVISEAYPELKVDPKMRNLVQLYLGREARVQERRTAYNKSVKEFNQSRMAFPAAYVSRLTGIRSACLFERSEAVGGDET